MDSGNQRVQFWEETRLVLSESPRATNLYVFFEDAHTKI